MRGDSRSRVPGWLIMGSWVRLYLCRVGRVTLVRTMPVSLTRAYHGQLPTRRIHVAVTQTNRAELGQPEFAPCPRCPFSSTSRLRDCPAGPAALSSISSSASPWS